MDSATTFKRGGPDDLDFLASMNQSQRKAYRKQLQKIPQVQYDLTKIKLVRFPNSGTFQFDNHKLNYNYVQATQNPKAILFYFHGLYCISQDGGLLGKIASKQCGINVYGLDYINAGKSQSDQPGYYKSIDYLVQQAYAFIQFILKKFKNPPLIFASALSMGCQVIFELAVTYPKLFSGTILISPALRQFYDQQIVGKKIGSCLKCIAPQCKLVPQKQWINCRYKNFQSLKDPHEYYLDKHIVASSVGVLDQMKWIEKNFKRFEVPYILFIGGVDKLSDPFAAVDMQRQSSSKDKRTVFYKDMWHESTYEPQYEEICHISSKWIKQRM